MIRTVFTFFMFVFVTNIFAQQVVSHQIFDELLQKYVDDQGMVNYKGLKADRTTLKSYLTLIATNEPQNSWTENQKLAYWINAYNAFTLELILKYYPVKSIKDIGSTIQIPYVNTPWDLKFIPIGTEECSLNHIEHGIIRKQFEEPRIHFALVCAAVSCPKLQNRAYLPEKLDEQLTKAATDFLVNPAKNQFISSKKVQLSKLFNWYGGDFTKNSTLIEYINQYAPTKTEKKASINWKDYDWALNEQK